MLGYEKLPIFDEVDARTKYRAIQLAIKRANLFRKPQVIIKMSILMLVCFLSLNLLFGSFFCTFIVTLLVASSVSRFVLKNEFDSYVKPLLEKSLADVQTLPNIRH